MMPTDEEFEGATRLLLTTCEDGFIYEIELMMDGIAKVTGESASFSTEMAIRDHNGDVVIEAPADARPLEAPSMP